MTNNCERKVITWGFNILLFFYLIYASLVSYLVNSESESHVPLDDFFEIAPAVTVVAAVLLQMLVILVGALVIRAFWNRLVASLFSIRDITYQEAVATILMFFLLVKT